MSFVLNAVFSLSVSLAAIIGWIRIKKIDPAFFPFILLMMAGLINESVSLLLVYKGYSNSVSFNLYSLAAALLLGWQFYKWGLFKRRAVYYLIQFVFLTGWMFETFVYSKNLFNSYFIIAYSFVVVLLCIEQINHEIFPVKRRLWTDPIFLICMGLLVFYTYSVMVEAFWHYGLNRSRFFRLRIYEIMAYINLFTNLLFAFAVLWIPLKPRYILRS
ncbi:hypothetical protein [Terrimonas pollutisoli]|uniref:hypothetical protein n=1 Tax=Terrimonas pollutisoli TaxID=3034147 RepID=UPI0023EBF03F|nr:hypothetical protein [Terrimonas sp. H1YJ31]